MTNERQNDSGYEVLLALSRLANADYNIRFFNDKVRLSGDKGRFSDDKILFSDDEGMEVIYRDAHGYKLSCGYRITNIGIFDSRSKKVNISRAYEKKLYEIAEKKFNSIKKISY